MKLNYFKLLDKTGNDMSIVPVHLSRASVVKDSISTGSLVCDLIIGGGWPAGRWVALFGPEASCKSTLLYHTLNDALKQQVNVEFFDFEGSTDPTYLTKILETDLSKVFGVRKENGNWDIHPQCRYHQPDLGEVYFRYMHRILKVLPDKIQHNNKWFYVYDKKPKSEFSAALYKNTKRYWVEAEDGSAQVIWFIDSLPAMLPERQDEKDESKEIGLQARMFSRYIPLIKSRLARKRCSVVAVNQIRLKPMAFGNPEYEMGGEAPKFYCFAGNTYLQTNKGLITALEANLEPPNQILGNNGLESPNIYKYMGKSPTLKISTDYGFELKAKPDHHVLALNKHIVIEWTKLSDLTKTHYVAIKTGSNIWPEQSPKFEFIYKKNKMNFSSKEIALPKKMSKDLARFLGYLTSEGYVKNHLGNYIIIFTKNDVKVMDDFCRIFETLFPTVNYKIVSNGGTKQFTVLNSYIFQFLQYLGAANKAARKKTVPWCILQAPKEYVIEFLIGYFTGDISISEKEATIASASKELLKQVQLLLLNIGILAKRTKYKSNWFSPLDERSKYAQLYISGEDLCILTKEIPLVSKKGKINTHGKNSLLRTRLPILNFHQDNYLLSTWIAKYKNSRKYFYKDTIDKKALEELQICIDKKITKTNISRGLEILSNIKLLLDYMDRKIFFVKVEATKYNQERVATFDASMPSSTIITNGIVSHNSDIRLQLRAVSNPFAKGQIAEEPCWDGIGIDRYRYIKVLTKKNKCFSPFRESLMRVWTEEKGDIGRGLDPVWDVYQYLTETGQIEEGKKGALTLTIDGPWVTKKTWKWQEFKELILNPNKAEVYTKYDLNLPEIGEGVDPESEEAKAILNQKLDLKGLCKQQLTDDTAFKLYFQTIRDATVKDKKLKKLCGNCVHFGKVKECEGMEEKNEACDDWEQKDD